MAESESQPEWLKEPIPFFNEHMADEVEVLRIILLDTLLTIASGHYEEAKPALVKAVKECTDRIQDKLVSQDILPSSDAEYAVGALYYGLGAVVEEEAKNTKPADDGCCNCSGHHHKHDH